MTADPHHLTISEALTFNDLVMALEQALILDGDRRRAMAVLALAKNQQWVEAELERARTRSARNGRWTAR